MATMTAAVVTADPAYDANRDGAATMTTGGRLRVDASGTSTSGPLPAGTDRSGATNAGAKDMAPANAARQSLTGQNVSDTPLWISENGSDASAGVGSYRVDPGVAFSIATNKRVSVFCTAGAGKAWTATET